MVEGSEEAKSQVYPGDRNVQEWRWEGQDEKGESPEAAVFDRLPMWPEVT